MNSLPVDTPILFLRQPSCAKSHGAAQEGRITEVGSSGEFAALRRAIKTCPWVRASWLAQAKDSACCPSLITRHSHFLGAKMPQEREACYNALTFRKKRWSSTADSLTEVQ